jgi:hypothetical protein
MRRVGEIRFEQQTRGHFEMPARSRSLRAELEARFRLGWLLFEQKKYPEAQAALAIVHLKFDESALDASTTFTLKSIRDLQAHLKARAGNAST